MTRGAQINN